MTSPVVERGSPLSSGKTSHWSVQVIRTDNLSCNQYATATRKSSSLQLVGLYTRLIGRWEALRLSGALSGAVAQSEHCRLPSFFLSFPSSSIYLPSLLPFLRFRFFLPCFLPFFSFPFLSLLFSFFGPFFILFSLSLSFFLPFPHLILFHFCSFIFSSFHFSMYLSNFVSFLAHTG